MQLASPHTRGSKHATTSSPSRYRKSLTYRDCRRILLNIVKNDVLIGTQHGWPNVQLYLRFKKKKITYYSKCVWNFLNLTWCVPVKCLAVRKGISGPLSGKVAGKISPVLTLTPENRNFGHWTWFKITRSLHVDQHHAKVVIMTQRNRKEKKNCHRLGKIKSGGDLIENAL